jgi:hypothetical protein
MTATDFLGIDTLILAAGAFNLALALFHLLFWRLFKWPHSLAASGALNRSVTQILNLAIAYLFSLSALVCFFFPVDLAQTALGQFWLLAMAIFWLARALVQPVFFGLRHPASLALFGVFVLGAVIHGMAWIQVRDL